jgi:alpha-tubulin suppressor-like RCC1 family protein
MVDSRRGIFGSAWLVPWVFLMAGCLDEAPGTDDAAIDRGGSSSEDAATHDAGGADGEADGGGDEEPTCVESPAALWSWSKVAAGSDHTCGLRSDGTLWCWGAAHLGQLGIGTTWHGGRLAPEQVVASGEPMGGSAWADWTAVAAGSQHTCGLRQDGTLWCWGAPRRGALGDGTLTEQRTPAQVLAAGEGPGGVVWTDWTAVEAGGGHTCGLREDGTLWCWGDGSLGSRGDGTSSWERSTPAQVVAEGEDPGGAAWSDWVSVAVGFDHTCGLRQGGTLWCWGSNRLGQRGDATTAWRTSPAQVLAADAEAGGEAWSDWTAVAAGHSVTCGLREGGSLWCWGGGANGRRGDGTTVATRTTPVRVVAADAEAGGEAWSDWTAVWASWVHVAPVDAPESQDSAMCGLRSDGSLWCWGYGAGGHRGDGSTEAVRATPAQVVAAQELEGAAPWVDWTSAAVGSSHGCGIRGSGRLWCWGAQPASAVPSQDERTTPFPVIDCWPPVEEPWTDWTTATAGHDTTCAARADGSLWCWGGGSYGQRGDGTTRAIQGAPSRVLAEGEAPGGTAWDDWTEVSTSIGNPHSNFRWEGILPHGRHTCGLRANGTLWCWGAAEWGALGNGVLDGPDHATPTPVLAADEPPGGEAWDDWVHVSVGGNHACGIRSNGTLWCWGANELRSSDEGSASLSYGGGELGDGTQISRATPTQVLAAGEEPGGAAWDDWVAVSAGGAHTCGLRSNGTLWCWGRNRYVNHWGWFWGHLGVGSNDSSSTPRQVVAEGEGSDGAAWDDWVAVSATTLHTCGLRSNGTLWCWGSGEDYSVGGGAPTQVLAADEEPGGEAWSDWVAVQAGIARTCGIRSDGSLWCWGLLTEALPWRTTPSLVLAADEEPGGAAWSDWSSVATGRHACGLRNGTLWCWGLATVGRLGRGIEVFAGFAPTPARVAAEFSPIAFEDVLVAP